MDKITALTLTGGNPHGTRKSSDFYPTPWEVTQALLDYLNIPPGAKIWEPACGEGHMVKVLEDNGFNVHATDIAFGQDFLSETLPSGTEWIITNPPFSLADEFIEKCISHNRPFALLLKSQFWHAKKRYRLFIEHPPAKILPLTWRPDFCFLDRKKGDRAAPLMEVFWCVWDGRSVSTSYAPLQKPMIKRGIYENIGCLRGKPGGDD